MKQRYLLSFLISALVFLSTRVDAQCLGAPGTSACRCYFPGHYLELGINNVDAFGAETPPSGYHPFPAGPLAEVYDYGHDGWTTGTPAYYGDYTYPGSPFEGWELQINGTSDISQAFTTGTASTIGGGGTLSGNLDTASYINSGGLISIVWKGTAGAGSPAPLNITQTSSMDTNGNTVNVTTVFKNVSGAAVPNIYYMRTCDPDNDEAHGGSFATNNTIIHQNENADHDVEVDAEGMTYHDHWSIVAKDCRARALIYEEWPLSSSTNLSTLWDTTYSNGSSAEYSLGGTLDGDYAIAVVFKICSLPAHDSTSISYAYVFNDPYSNIDIALPDPEIVLYGTSYDSAATANTCLYPSGLEYLPVTLANANSGAWSWSTWTWSPSTALASVTGTSNTVDIYALSGTITYTITGTAYVDGSGATCDACGSKTLYLTVIPCFNAGNNHPCQGDTLQLLTFPPDSSASYAWYSPSGALLGTTQNVSVYPATLADDGTYMAIKTTTGSTGSASDTTYTNVVVRPLPVFTLSTNAPVCSGSTLNVLAHPDSSDDSMAWYAIKININDTFFTSGPAIGDSFTSISPVAASDTGWFKVYTSLNGCYDSNSIHVGIDSTPPVPVVSNNAASAICSDSTLYLFGSDSTSGGTVTWAWTGPNGFYSTLQNPVIFSSSIANAGTYTLVASLNGTCTDSATTTVLINPTPPLPVLSTGAPVCTGSTLYLFATDTPGAVPPPSYSWSGPNGFISAAQDPYITGATTAATGLYTVVATLNGCPSSPSYLEGIVDSTPMPLNVSSNSIICQGDTLMLFATDSTALVTYSWAGPLAFSSTLENPVVYDAPPTASGIYNVTATLAICSVTSSVDVTVKPVPALISVGSSSPVCTGNDLFLFSSFSGDAGGIYNWYGPGYNSSAQDPELEAVTTGASGVYSVNVTLNGCTSATATVAVVVDSTPVAPVAGSNTPVCQGDTLMLSATDATDSVTYAWFGPNGFSSIEQGPSIVNVPVAAAGVYSVSAILGMCINTSATTVVIIATPSFIPTSNSPVCSGDTLLLQANADSGSTYSWAGPYAFYAASASPEPIIGNVTAENAGVYTVTATLNGCPKSEEDTVVVNATPAPPFVGWLTYCQNYIAPPLMATGENITWYPGDSLSGGSSTAPVPSTAVPGSTFYFATQTVSNCLSSIDSIQVTVNPAPSLSVSPADTGVCPHSTFMLTAVDTDAIAYYRWYPDIYLGDTTTDTVSVSPETDQAYTVVASNQYGCSDTDTVHITVYPSALIAMANSVTLYPGESYTMSPSTNCTFFSWFPSAGLSSTSLPDPVAAPAASTKYIVTGQTDNGCTTTDSISINLSASSLLAVPNAFTPGSGGPNTEFRVIKKGEATLGYFRIFDRWGQKVFETTDIDAGWDGSYNGTPQPLGVYVYEIQAVASNGQNFVMQGNVTLLR